MRRANEEPEATMREGGSVAHCGIVAGLPGAGAVALWTGALDWATGRRLSTPALLGRALIGALAPAPLAESPSGATPRVQFAGGDVAAARVTAAALDRSHPAVRDRVARAADDAP
jgi:hypothetical protein